MPRRQQAWCVTRFSRVGMLLAMTERGSKAFLPEAGCSSDTLSTGACAPPPDRRPGCFSLQASAFLSASPVSTLAPLFPGRGRWLRLAPGWSLIAGPLVGSDCACRSLGGRRKPEKTDCHVAPLLAMTAPPGLHNATNKCPQRGSLVRLLRFT